MSAALTVGEARRSAVGPRGRWTVRIRFSRGDIDWGDEVAIVKASSESEAEERGVQKIKRRFSNGMFWSYERSVSAVRALLVFAILLGGCAAMHDVPREPLAGYAAIATDDPPTAEYFTWRLTPTFEIETHLRGCTILIGADDLTDPVECVVLGEAVHAPGRYPEPELWSFGRGRVLYDELGFPHWYGTGLERTGRPPARVSFHTGRNEARP